MADLNSFWKDAVTSLEGQIPGPQMETWIAPLRLLKLDGDTLIVGVPNELQKTYLVRNYLGKIEAALLKVSGRPLSVRLDVCSQTTPPVPRQAAQSADPIPLRGSLRMGSGGDEGGLPLNPRHVFESFVVGNSNRFAHAAAQGVAEKLGQAHNPLFLYGGVGLGKTHLLHAIGNYTKARFPGKRVVYTTSEKFTNDLIRSIHDQNMTEFRKKYRNKDLLLIDDIQFLQGKESTQQEFFHTYNDMLSVQHQIVATSDTHPKDIKVEDRLRSRFQGGLVADLQPPDFETRVAILKKKAQSDNLSVPEEVLSVIASAAQSNIRELEGALNRVIAFAAMANQPLSEDLARETLRDLLAAHKSPQTFLGIQSTVARYFSLEVAILSDRTRTDAVAYPRHLAMYLCRELLNSSYDVIGVQFGGRDHSTVLHAIEKIKRMQETNDQTKIHITDIRKSLNL